MAETEGQAATSAQEAPPSPTAEAPPVPEAPSGGAERDRAAPRRRRRPRQGGHSRCRFCREGIAHVDYKDTDVLQSLTRGQGRITARQRTGTCAKYQRLVKKAIKRARYMALLGYNEGPPRGRRPFF